MEEGKISFSMLEKLSQQFTKIAEGTLRLYMEGSSARKGRTPEWLKKSLNFNLTGLKKGSTVLDLEAPLLTETLKSMQMPLFSELEIDTLEGETAMSLSMYSYEKAFSEEKDTALLDKLLLKDMLGFRKFLQQKNEVIELSYKLKQHTVSLEREKFAKVKVLEKTTPRSVKVKITGKLDLMRHSNSQLEIITERKKIRAFLPNYITFDMVKEHFGKDVTISGMANFNPGGKITAIELLNIGMPAEGDDYFRKVPKALKKSINLHQLSSEKNYTGTDLDKIVGKWPGDESIDELLYIISK